MAIVACRTNKQQNSVATQTVVTATVSTKSADTIRTAADINVGSKETSFGIGKEQTNIHIDRDSAGNITDINVNKTTATQGETEKTTSGNTAIESSGKHEEKKDAKQDAETTEAKPVKADDHSAAQKIVGTVFLVLFILIMGSLAIRAKK